MQRATGLSAEDNKPHDHRRNEAWHGTCNVKDMDESTEISDFRMPALSAGSRRVVLQHTQGRMAGVHSICGLAERAVKPLPEFLDTVDLIDTPSMRTPGPVGLVAVKPRYVLYRQIFTPELQNGMTFKKEQR